MPSLDSQHHVSLTGLLLSLAIFCIACIKFEATSAVISPPPLAPISLPAEPTEAPTAETPSEVVAAEPTEEELIAALPKPPSSLKDLDFLGDATGADLTTLLNLLTEHIAQEGGLPLGRKLKL